MRNACFEEKYRTERMQRGVRQSWSAAVDNSALYGALANHRESQKAQLHVWKTSERQQRAFNGCNVDLLPSSPPPWILRNRVASRPNCTQDIRNEFTERREDFRDSRALFPFRICSSPALPLSQIHAQDLGASGMRCTLTSKWV